MPIYSFFCPDHGETELYRHVDDAGKEAVCEECGKVMQRVWGVVPHTVDFEPGWQPAFGKWVDTKRERDNLVAEKGLIRG